jgi:hypothetical protein
MDNEEDDIALSDETASVLGKEINETPISTYSILLTNNLLAQVRKFDLPKFVARIGGRTCNVGITPGASG